MHISRKLVALGASVALMACYQGGFAQDDLDDLLRDLEAESAAGAQEPAAETAEEPEVDDIGAAATGEEVEPVAEPAEEPEPAAEEPAEEPEPAAEEPAEEPEPAAEPSEEPEPAAEEPAEEPEPAAEEPAEEPEPAAEEPAVEPAEEPVAEEEPTVAPAEEPAPAAAQGEDDLDSLLDEVGGESPAEPEPAKVDAEEPAEEPEPAAEEPAAEEPAPVAEEPEVVGEPGEEETDDEPVAVTPPAKPAVSEDDELLANIIATERIRREAYDQQARREIEEARVKMQIGEYSASRRHYTNAINLLTDNAANAPLRKECRQGIAESLYQLALQEYATGTRDKARDHMRQANELRHPKAAGVLEAWLLEGDPDENKTPVSEITRRRNEEEYINRRAENLKHLKRSREYLGTKELDKALDECDIVLANDPYNETALSIRKMIQLKRQAIMQKEREATRAGMIADVDKAWRPAYAVNALEVKEAANKTMRIGEDDPSRAQELQIIKSMKDMRIPTIDFKPPSTIADAIDFFRLASRDYGNPEIPADERMINFVLKTPVTLHASQEVEEVASGFGAGGGDDEGGETYGLPVIPTISASNISMYDALKLVCDQCEYKFKVQPPVVMVMPKNATIDELITRSYPVVSEFMTRMESASSDVKDMRAAGFGAGNNLNRRGGESSEDNQQQEWKDFFSLLGVNWPEGSQIMYLKTLGKLRVKNTYENLAELEKALNDLSVSPRLIEIEARFVEVCQEDLNSLGFEWILNSDYSIGLGKHVGRALGIRKGSWGSSSSSSTQTSSTSRTTGSASGSGSTGGVGNTGGTVTSTTPLTTTTINDSTTYTSTSSRTNLHNSNGASWIRNGSSKGNVGLNAFGGNSTYSTNMRYLSTDSNHISGEGYSNNDQFMRVNAYLGTADLSMILHMLSQRSDTDLLSAPKVLTRNGEQAVIKVVTEYIYPTDYDVQLQSSSSSSSSSSGGSQSAILAIVEPQNFTMREVGVILDVTPTLTPESNLIDLKLDTRVVDEPTWKNYGMRIPFTGNSSLQSFEGIGDILTGLSEVLDSIGTGLSDTVKAAFAEQAVNSASSALDSISQSSNENITYYDAPMEQPFFHVRSIETSVSVYPGATIVMGGLITEQRKAMDDKIPFLGDLPFIGRLFRSHSEQTNKRNLMIFLTTRLVDVHGREIVLEESDQKESDYKEAPEDDE